MTDLARRLRDFVYWRSRRAQNVLRASLQGIRARNKFDPVPAEVRYPSYKSLDPYLDVERLQAIDASVRAGVERCLTSGVLEPFDTGLLKAKPWKRRVPGSRVIPLTIAPPGKFRYHDLDKAEKWQPSPAQELFPELMEFIATLPFERTARMMIMCDDRGREVTTHRDHPVSDVLHEFVWFRTNLDKPFFVVDREHGKKEYVRSYTAWFDTVNQYHGAEAANCTTISIRVDGRFHDAFRARIPEPPCNLASTPSYWCALEDQQAG